MTRTQWVNLDDIKDRWLICRRIYIYEDPIVACVTWEEIPRIDDADRWPTCNAVMKMLFTLEKLRLINNSACSVDRVDHGAKELYREIWVWTRQ